MTASALPIKIAFDPGGNPSGLAEFVAGQDHISSGLLQLSALSGETDLSSLRDVSSYPNITEGQILTWSGATWIASSNPITNTDTSTLSALGDTSTFPDVSNGESLSWNGSQWVASSHDFGVYVLTDGTRDITGHQKLTSSMGVSGAASIGSTVSSTGAITTNGNVNTSGNIRYTGNTSGTGNITTRGNVEASTNVNFGGNISGTGSWNVRLTSSGLGPTPNIPCIVLTTDDSDNKGTDANLQHLTPSSGSWDVRWNTTIYKHSSFFTHSTLTNKQVVTVTYPGLYEVQATMAVSSADGRIVAEQYVVINGTPPSPGAYKPTMYIYDRSLTGADEASGHLVSIHSLAAGSTIRLRSQRESNNDGVTIPLDKECIFVVKKLA